MKTLALIWIGTIYALMMIPLVGFLPQPYMLSVPILLAVSVLYFGFSVMIYKS